MQRLTLILIFLIVVCSVKGQRLRSGSELVSQNFPSGFPSEIFDTPFVRDDFKTLKTAIIKLDTDSEEVVKLKSKITNLLSSESTIYSRVTIEYAGKFIRGDEMRYLIKLKASECLMKSGEGFRCGDVDCELELVSKSNTLDDLSLLDKTCWQRHFCHVCEQDSEIECPIIDRAHTQAQILSTPVVSCRMSNFTKMDNESWICFSEYNEIAGLRTYIRMGCRGVGIAEQMDQCSTDSNFYSYNCSCVDSLCNDPKKNRDSRRTFFLENQEFFDAFRQLKRHFELEMDRRCKKD